MKKDLVLFGIQGSGKGTQGKILAEKMQAAYFEMGGELRKLSHEESELGKKVKAIIDGGNLVPNEVVMEIVEHFVKNLKDPATRIIFDGIPRTAEQSASFEKLVSSLGRDYTGVYFELSRRDAENRLLKRRICSNCKSVFPTFYTGTSCEKCGGQLAARADDNAEAIQKRLDIFYTETVPVVKKWESVGRMIRLDGSGSIEEVTAELFKKFGL